MHSLKIATLSLCALVLAGCSSDGDNAPAIIPTVAFASAAANAAEGAGAVPVTVTVSPVPSAAITVSYTVAGSAGVADRTVEATPVTIPAGSASATFDVTLIDDAEVEGAETVVITLQAPAGAQLGTPSVHTLTIDDNDVAPPASTVRFSAAAQSAGEDAGTVNILVTVSPLSPTPISVPYSGSGSASAADFAAPVGPLVIPANTASASIPVALVNDAADEGDETLIVTLGTPTGAQLGSPSVHTLTITDDDGTPTVRFDAGAQSAREDAGTVNVVVRVSPVSPSPITVSYSGSGTASVADFTAPVSPLVIPANTATANIPITLTDDAIDEPDETLVITLGATAGAQLGSPSVHTLTIGDNDGVPVVRFDTGAQSATENAGTVNIVVSVSPTSPTPITVPYSGSGSASVADFTAPVSPLVIPANTASASIPVTIVDDATGESDETIIVTLGAPTGADLGTPSVHTLTIADNDGGSVLQGTLFLLTDEYRLLRFQASAPAATVGVDISGILDGPGGFPDVPLALEFRPGTGELYLYVADRRVYVVDPLTGAATLRGNTPATLTNNIFGFDFNPCVDRIRALGDDGSNFRLNPDGSLLAVDTALAYAAGDVNAGALVGADAVAYVGCPGGVTTTFVIDSLNDVLATLGNAGGAPSGPGSGQLFTVGSLVTPIGGAGQVAFDIDVVDNLGYTADTDGATTVLFSVNLATGVLTNLGNVADGVRQVRVAALAVQP